MSRPQKILVDFNRFTNSALVSKVEVVITALTGSTVITTPQPTIAELQAALDDLSASMTAAELGGKAQREVRDQKRAIMVGLMKQEAAYVSLIANGDVATMLGAGFDVSKTPSPIGPLPMPVKFTVTSPDKGQLRLSLPAIRGAKNYQFEYKKVGDTAWTIVPSTKATLLVQGLESVKEFVGRVLPIGASDDRVYSKEITATVI